MPSTRSQSSRGFIVVMVLLTMLIVSIVRRILNPSSGAYEMDDCYRDYARSLTLSDTLSVDSRQFSGFEGDSLRQCGVLRGL